MQSADRLTCLLGLFSPLAVRLLQLRAFSQQTPDLPASQVLEAEVVAIIAARTAQLPSMLTVKAFWTEVARMGGFVGSLRRWPTRLENRVEGLAPVANPA